VKGNKKGQGTVNGRSGKEDYCRGKVEVLMMGESQKLVAREPKNMKKVVYFSVVVGKKIPDIQYNVNQIGNKRRVRKFNGYKGKVELGSERLWKTVRLSKKRGKICKTRDMGHRFFKGAQIINQVGAWKKRGQPELVLLEQSDGRGGREVY